MASQRSPYNPANASFFHSLASIRRDLSRNRSRSQPRSSSADELEFCYEMQDNIGDRTTQPQPLRRARSSDTPMSGILKTRSNEEQDKEKSPIRRVSFCRSRDGTYNNVHVTRHSSMPTLASTASPSFSLRNSPNWPPPPPPRRSSIDISTPTRQGHDLSTVLRSDQVERLPFPVTSRTARVPPPPPPPPPYRRRSDGVGFNNARNQENTQVCVRGRGDYVLGEFARSLSHMIIDTSPQETKVSELEDHDFAFVKRSDGSWSYAILAHRYRSRNEENEYMMFVLNEVGATKIFKKRQWAKGICCVAISENGFNDRRVILHDVPKTISIKPDECLSVISDFWWYRLFSHL